ncbi:hypothetical protein [Corynebacterium rouxii]
MADIATPSSAYSDPGICAVWLVNARNMASTMVSGFVESVDFGGVVIVGG